jgi:hypothetical protein
MSIVDIIITSLSVMPLTAYFTLVGVNSLGCKIWSVMVNFRAVIFVYSHVAIVINRYSANTCPLSYHSEIRCKSKICVFGYDVRPYVRPYI